MISFALHGSSIARLATDISVSHLKELQRFAAVGRVSASLIHDMTSPLTAAILHLEQDEPRALSSVRQARRSIRVLESYIEAARQQLRHDESSKLFAVRHETSQAKHILEPLGRNHGVRLHFDVQNDCRLKGSPIKFQRILTNLVTNSMDAYRHQDKTGRPLVRITLSSRRKILTIRVRDWGPGIAPEQLPRIFDPFYTTKQHDESSGTGIGLYNVRCYVEDDFAGKITALRPSGGGMEFKVELPLA